MNTIVFALILVSGNGGGPLHVANFFKLENCQKAAREVKGSVAVSCVPLEGYAKP